MKRRLVIGTRKSDLALWQTDFVKKRLESISPDHEFEIKTLTTTGDRLVDVALSKIGDKGLFTRQIEDELFDGGIDLAVHSLKDLQTVQPDGLCIGAVCTREVPNDALVSRKYGSIAELPEGATVATGSLRRKSQLLNYRQDLNVVAIRGNVPTRLRKFEESGLDALILAYAGLYRLGLDETIRQLIPLDIMLPAVGQGAIAVEIRESDSSTADLVNQLDDAPTRICITAERAFLRELEGGCQVPIGGHARLEGDDLTLEGFVGTPDGSVVLRDRLAGHADKADEVGKELARTVIANGANELLAEARSEIAADAETTL